VPKQYRSSKYQNICIDFVQFNKQEVNVDNYISEKNYKNKHLLIMNVLLWFQTKQQNI